MNPRTRRWLIGAGIVVALLFVGRWVTEFLTERWWAASISPAAMKAVTRWQLLGLILDVSAIALASCWFILQALVITRQIGNLELRQTISTRFLLMVAIAAGVLLGWISGAGAHDWRGPVALAWQGVTWGAKDPLLNADLGDFLTRLPLWQLSYDFLLTLLVTSLGFSFALYSAMGSIGRDNGRIQFSPPARRHIGWQLALLGLALSLGFLLDRWEAAASIESGNLESARLQMFTARPFAALAVATALLSLRWGLGRNGRSVSFAWVATFLVIIFGGLYSSTEPATREDRIRQRNFTDMAWGVHRVPATVATDTVPRVTPIWDEILLARNEASADRRYLTSTPTTIALSGEPPRPTWLIASTDSLGQRVDVHAIEAGNTGDDGGPRGLQVSNFSIPDARTHPGAPAWRETTDGVGLSNLFVKLVVAWGLQAGSLPALPGKAYVDWHLDPTDRAAAILPMALWLPPDVAILNDHPVWVTQGLIPLNQFPLSSRQKIRGSTIAGLLPAFLAIIDIESGATTFVLDPAAGPVAIAWSAFARSLIVPFDSLPADFRNSLPYSAAWALLQTDAVGNQVPVTQSMLFRQASLVPAIWQDASSPARQYLAVGSPLVTMLRQAGMPRWQVDSEASRGTASREELQQRFQQHQLVMHLRDSVTAMGDTALMGAMRWWHGPTSTTAWRPLLAMNRTTGPKLLAVASERDHQTRVDRTIDKIWSATGTLNDSLRISLATAERDQLEQARKWMALADSALRRGDLTAFGRYFESLQRVLNARP